MMREYGIGEKLKTLRQQKKLTLKDVATRTGFSVALLSQIENNNISPPISTLSKLTKVFDVKIGSLFEEGEPRFVVMRRYGKPVPVAHPIMNVKNAHFWVPNIHGMKNRKMTPYLITLTADNQGNSISGREGESFIHVVKGRFEISLDGIDVTLEEGDSLYFDTSMAQVYRLKEGTEATILEVRTT